MNCDINKCFMYKSNKIAKIDAKIKILKSCIDNMNNGRIRQCHNDILNTYVINSRVRQISSQIKYLENVKYQLKKISAEELVNSDALINSIKMQYDEYNIVSIDTTQKCLLKSV